jgi:hypothetical protein
MAKHKAKPHAHWMKEPAEKNYPAAQSYLTLLFDEKIAEELVQKLRKAPVVQFMSKDIFRASQLPLLGIANYRVKDNKRDIKQGKELSPILLVRDRVRSKVIVADGYHRLCAVYHFHEEADIPCKIVSCHH